MIFAQTPPAAPDPLGGYSSIANLGAVGVALTLLIYIIVWGWPKMMDRIDSLTQVFTSTLKEQRDDFQTELRNDRDSFREELRAGREQSNRLATSGHDSVNNLAREVSELRNSLKGT